jgi:hypothetical protein
MAKSYQQQVCEAVDYHRADTIRRTTKLFQQAVLRCANVKGKRQLKVCDIIANVEQRLLAK